MTTATASLPSPKKLFRASLWTVQALLAAAFLMSGAGKLLQPMAALAQQMPWTADMPELLVRFIGAAELAGALGLVLPALTRIKPALTPLAALGLATIMVLASLTHIVRGELAIVPVNAVLGALALFVAWGRGRKAPIAARR